MNYFLITQQFSQKNVKKYFSFMLSCIECIFLYFLFTPFLYNEEIFNIKNQLIVNIIRGSMSIIIVILSFFTIYSFYSYIKVRSNEFKTLFILGLTKKELQKLILFEQFYLICISSLIGMLLGTIFLKLFFLAVYKYLGLVSIGFSVNLLSYVYTVIFAGALYVIILQRNIITLKEIDIVHKSMKSKKKNKLLTFIKMALAILLIIIESYCIINWKESSLNSYIYFYITCVVVLYFYLFLLNHLIVKKVNKRIKNNFFVINSVAKNIEKEKYFIFFTVNFANLFTTYYYFSDLFFSVFKVTPAESKLIHLTCFITYFLYFFISSQILYLKVKIELTESKEYYNNMFIIGFMKKDIIKMVVKQLRNNFFTPIVLVYIMTAAFIFFMVRNAPSAMKIVWALLCAFLLYYSAYIKAKNYLNSNIF